MLLKGKKIVIMGIRNKWSIAWGAAKSAADNGAQVIFTYHAEEDSAKIQELVSEIPNYSMYPCDVSKDEEIKALFELIHKEHGNIDGILHSIAHANTSDLRGDFLDTSRDGFAHANDASAYSFVAVARYSKPYLNENASLVTLTYHGSTKVMDGYNVMGVAKAALETSVMYLADSMGKDGFRVNAISAGPIKTLSAKGIKDFNKMLDIVEERAPLHKNVTTDEVGDVATFLFSKLSSCVTGQVIYADNGYVIMGI